MVAQDSNAESLLIWQDEVWPLTKQLLGHGNHLLRADVHKRGLTMDYFGEVIVSGAHSKSFEMVVNGGAEVASIDHSVFDLWPSTGRRC